MGLFDFLKPKKDPMDALMDKDPSIRREVLWQGCKSVETEAANLRAVGRKDDADRVIAKYLEEVFQEFKKEPENPRQLFFLVEVALRLCAFKPAKKVLESVIAENDPPSLDLTTVYMDLGRIYHRLGTDPKRELWCYEMATEAKAPPGCKFPATRTQKAMAHHFAHFVATRIAHFVIRDPKDPHLKIAESHLKSAKELVPEVNWDNQSEVFEFFKAEYASMRSEAGFCQISMDELCMKVGKALPRSHAKMTAKSLSAREDGIQEP